MMRNFKFLIAKLPLASLILTFSRNGRRNPTTPSPFMGEGRGEGRWYWVFLLFFIFIISPISASALTRQLPLSGQLLTPAKTAVPDGDYTMRFSIYTADRAVSDSYPSDSDSGARVWNETQTVKVERGLWKVVLGSTTALPDTLNFETGNYYLGIRINTDPEMVPRKKILPVPLALNAESLGGAKPGTGSNDILRLDSAGAINITGNITTAGILQGANLIVSSSIQLPANSILTADIMDGTISTIDLADSLITTIKLADASVSGSKIVDSSVSTGKLADSSVTISKIADGAITTVKISDGSVATSKINDLAVTTLKIADGAITAAKLADASITAAKLATGDLHFQNTDTGATSLSFGLGTGTAIGTNNFSLTASNTANKPAVRYNGSTGKWQISNDGTTFADIGSSLSSSLQAGYDAGNAVTTTDNRNILFTLANTATDSNFLINIQGTGNIFQIQDGGTPIFTVADGGLATFGGNINLSGNRITNASRIDGNASGSFLYTTVDVRQVYTTGTSLALDSSNYPHILYYTSDNSAAVISDWDGSQWTITDFDTTGTRGRNNDLVIDEAGVKHAVYQEEISYDSNLIYAKYVGSGGNCSGSAAWDCTIVDSTGDVATNSNSIDVDGSNIPHISYYDNINGNLKHAWFVGSGGNCSGSAAWNCEIVESANNVGSSSAIAINRANGNIHITYYDTTNGDLRYVKYSGGSWGAPVNLDGSAGCIATGCGTRNAGSNSTGSNLTLNASGNPRVSYNDYSSDDLYYAYSNDGGTTWTTAKIDGGSGVTGTGCTTSGNYGQYSSLTLDSGGNPHISYYNYSTYDLRYASNNGSVWTCQTLDSTNDVGRHTSIKLTNSNKVYISYQDNTNIDTKLVSNNYPKLNIYGDLSIMGETGNLGIGTLLPTERLDVTGNIKATGNVSSSQVISANNGFSTSSSSYLPTIYGSSSSSANLTLSSANNTTKGNIYINPGGQKTVIGNSAASASLATAGLQIVPNYLYLQLRYYNPGTGYTYSGNTGEANSYGGTPFTLVSAVGDMAYLGSYQPFGALEIDLAALGAGGAVAWEYWNGAWVALTATDGTTNFTADGVVSFTPPADWVVNSVNGYSAYWIRANVTATAYTTAPTANSTIIGRFGTTAAPLVASLIQPAGIADSTTWSATGTMLGINTPSSFNGNFIDLQSAGNSKFVVTSAGNVGIGTASPATALQINGDVKLDTAIASGSLLLGNDQDDFSSSILETGWTFAEISPSDASDYSLTANTGHLQITVPAGSAHDCWTGVTDCARMLRSVSNTDAAYSTKIDGVNITADAQTYGIMLWQDSSNYLRFEFWTNGSVIQPTAWKVIGGVGSSAFGGSPNISLGTSNYLRVTKSGDNFYLDYSTNGSVWERSGSFTQAGFTVNQAGVHVINAAGSNPATTANFDYFHINQGGNLQVGGMANIAGILNVQNAAAFLGNLTLSKADPSIIFNTLSRTDTDFWLGVQEDGAGTDNDLFQIGDGTTVGTNPFFTIDTSGNVGIGTASPTQKLSIAYGNLSFTQVSSPGAPTVAVGAAGVLTGNYYYKITLVTANGETSLGTASSLVAPSSQRVDLSSIPTGAADQGVTARRIYRTSAGGTDYYLLTTINDNTTTIYTDNTADGSLGTNIANNLVNTTAGFFYLNGSKAGYLGGNRTVALGVSALDNLTYGGANSAIGNFALLNTTTGSMNTAFGYSAVMTNVTGQGNTVIGYKAGEGTSGGSYSDNTILGGEAGQSLSTGSNNVLVGRSVGGLTTGSNNIILGYNINAPTTSTSNYLSIGNILYGSLNTGRIGINVNSSFAGNLDIRQYADGDQIIYARRNTDTSPTGNFIQFRNAAGTGTIFGVDISGNLGVGATPDTGARLYATNSGSGIINVARLTNDIPAANNSGVQILFGANRTTSGMSNIAGVAGLITDITDAAYKGALIFSTADNAVPVERARIDNVGNVSFGVNVTSGTTTVDLGGTGTGNAVCHTTQTGTDNEGLVDCTSGPIADYAEMYPVASGIEYGDVVVVGAKMLKTKNGDNIAQLVKSSAPYQSTTIGIVSNNYGDFTSAGYNIRKEDNPMPVALNGRVPVKLSLENGPIAAGDPLTSSSTPGVAMKATGSGYIIGKALESFTPSPQPSPIGRGSEGEGKILVFVNPGWYNPLTGPLVQGGDNQFDEINIGNLATTKDLVVTGLARIKGDLIVEGKVRGDLEVEGIVKTKGIVGGWRSYENHFLNSKFENEFTVSEIASSSREDGTPRNDSEGGVSWEYHKIKLATDSLAGSKVALDHSFNFKPADDEIGATWRFIMRVAEGSGVDSQSGAEFKMGLYADEQNYALILNGTEPQSLKFISCAVGECTTTDNISVDPAAANRNYVVMIKQGEAKLLIDGQEYAIHSANVPADSILHFYEEITTNIDASQSAVLDYLGVMVGRYEPF